MKNYSRMTEAQKQNTVDKPVSKVLLFESSKDCDDWMQRLAKKVQESQNRGKNEIK